MNFNKSQFKKSLKIDGDLGNTVSILYRSLPFVLSAVRLAMIFKVAMVFMACSPNDRHILAKEGTPEKTLTPTSGKAEGGGPSTDASDDLADEGESLLQNVKLSEAFGKFNEALQSNPQNHRATFWRASLRPLLEFKGIARRVHPLYQQAAGNSGRYERMKNDLSKSNNSAMEAFLNDGPEDIGTPEALQEWMDRLRNSIVTFRQEIRLIREAELSIVIPSFFYSGKQGNSQCRSMSFGPVMFDGLENSCGSSVKNTIGVNRADLESILALAGVYQAYLELWTAYSINTVSLMSGDQNKIDSRESAEAAVKSMFSGNRGGELRQAKPFSGIRDLTSEMITGLKFIQDNQQELCPHGYSTPENRKGYLIAAGLCIQFSLEDKNHEGNEATRAMRTLETFLTGRPVDLNVEGTTAKFKAMAVFENPPKDLKDLAPFVFDECGTLIKINAQATSAYFTEGDINSLLAIKTREAQKNCLKTRPVR
jgi:hypothetical protein